VIFVLSLSTLRDGRCLVWRALFFIEQAQTENYPASVFGFECADFQFNSDKRLQKSVVESRSMNYSLRPGVTRCWQPMQQKP
jgi:hypothetical protein